MANQNTQMCPLFPDMTCPRGEEAVKECTVRINGNYDPVADFRDLLLMHCAIYQQQQYSENQIKVD